MKQAEIYAFQAIIPYRAPKLCFRDGLIPQNQVFQVWKLTVQMFQIQFVSIAGKGDPVEIFCRYTGQNRCQGLRRIRTHFHRLIIKPWCIQGSELRFDLLIQFQKDHAFYAGLIIAVSHGTAGPGAQGIPGTETVVFMDMSQCQIVEAGQPYLLGTHGAVRGRCIGSIAVENADVPLALTLCLEVFQKRRAIHGFIARTVNSTIQIGQCDGLHHRMLEDIHVFRPILSQICRIRLTKIMITRSDKHWNLYLFQSLVYLAE